VSRGTARPNYEIRPPSIFGFNLLANLSKLLQYKDLIWTLSLHRIKVRYKQSVLGVLWAFLQPISMMLVFTFIFSLIARMPSEGIPYAIFAFTALLPWNYFSTSVSNGTNSLVKDSQFVTKVYFPREILPITYIIAALFDFAIALVLLACLMIYYQIALTAMRVLKTRGLRIPDDVAVYGFNAFPFTEFADPALTTVRSPAYELGEKGAELLLARLESGQFASIEHVLPVSLVPGASG